MSQLKFQFLMVRLKEVIQTAKEVFKEISIPYGAIKRIHEPSGILPNF